MAIPTLPDVKAQLNITVATNDEELNTYLKAALRMVENRVGPSYVQQFTEAVSGMGPGMVLSKRPIASIVSLTPLLDTWPSYTGTDVNFDAASGAVWRKDMGSLAGAYSVVYTAGWATFPDNYNLAVRLLVQDWWRSQRGGSARPSMGTPPDFTSSSTSRGQFPPVVEALLVDTFPGGIA